MKCIDELSPNELRGKRVLLRAGLDLPIDAHGVVADTYRLKQSCATLEYLKNAGSRTIVISKIGRDQRASNAPVAEAMKQFFPVFFVSDITGRAAQDAVRAMRDGDIMLLENLQRDPREIAGDEVFASELAALAELFVNDAFPSAHRSSATMVQVPRYLPSYAGLQFRDEVRELSLALNPPHPSLAIIGGAKFETKDPIIRSFLEKYDHVCVVGAIANDILKVQGFPVGRSKISDHAPERDVATHPHLLAPVDVVAERSDKQVRVKKPHEIDADDKIVDIGPETVQLLAPHIAEAKLILWNGPTGLYEEGYTEWSFAIAEMIAESSARKVIGGGDTIAVVEASKVPGEKLGFLSTGGGAMLEFLLKGTLPAIQALG